MRKISLSTFLSCDPHAHMNKYSRSIRWLPVILIILASQTLYSQETRRPKVGLVLSGGGAKGFAHIGTLKLIDSLQIPIDYIAGTSMGAIVGGLYAIGYTGHEVEKMAERNDWEEIFSDTPPRPQLPFFQKEQSGRYQLEFGLNKLKPVTPSGLIFGQKVSLLLSSFTYPFEKIDDFDKLPIPFRCVAVDLITGNEVILRNGSLAKALRASMSIPTVFSPVAWGDSLLVDGGISNNMPVDVVRDMGAEIVITVDVQSPLQKREELNSALAVLNQTVSLVGMERWQANTVRTDVMIRPDISGFTPADFDRNKIRQLLLRGDQAALQALPQLLELQSKNQLCRLTELGNNPMCDRPWVLTCLRAAGNTIHSSRQIFTDLNLQPGMTFDAPALQKNIQHLKTLGQYEDIKFELLPVTSSEAELLLHVTEGKKVHIRSIFILNNRKLPFLFIYRLLGLRSGDPLDVEKINQRIMSLYGMGYFELINYEISHPDDQWVDLTFHVKELPLRKLRVGLRYDDLHKLVAAVSVQATNFVIPGLRLENELQFAGLTQFRFRASYPSRALDLPIYPFARWHYKDIPTRIFDDHGNRIAEYRDRSFLAGAGLGLMLTKDMHATLEYQQEFMGVQPNIAFPDPEMFPSWHDKLRKVLASAQIDLLDDVILPRNGFRLEGLYEASLEELRSEVAYRQYRLSFDGYSTFASRHTLRIFAFNGWSSPQLPIYKFINLGRPGYFVGVDYDQLFSSGLSVLRGEYRYQHRKDIFFHLIANYAFDVKYEMPDASYFFKRIKGFGLGVTLLSPVGPVEIILSRGDKDWLSGNKLQTVVYFVMGYRF